MQRVAPTTHEQSTMQCGGLRGSVAVDTGGHSSVTSGWDNSTVVGCCIPSGQTANRVTAGWTQARYGSFSWAAGHPPQLALLDSQTVSV